MAKTAEKQREPRSVADRVARQLLRLEDVAPRALFPMKGSLLISAVRCVITYAILPALAPLVGLSGAVSRPVAIVLSAAAIVLAVVSLRRVWAADWNYRWAYTAFSLTVLVLLSMTVVIDVWALLA
jgi:hypothetical protein